VAGQSWIYEYVERPLARALCEGQCGMNSSPTSTLFAFPLALLAGTIAAVLLGAAFLRARSPGAALRVSLLTAVVVAAASSIVVLQRSNWLRGADEVSVCFEYPDQLNRPAQLRIDPALCGPEHEPASAIWILAAGVLLVLGAVAAAVSTGATVRGPRKSPLER
jgi:ABC-type branched-subunit amino acid transport system permease subunit